MILYLDLPFIAWSREQIQEREVWAAMNPIPVPKTLPFTFNHLPSELVQEGRGIILVTIGVKS